MIYVSCMFGEFFVICILRVFGVTSVSLYSQRREHNGIEFSTDTQSSLNRTVDTQATQNFRDAQNSLNTLQNAVDM